MKTSFLYCISNPLYVETYTIGCGSKNPYILAQELNSCPIIYTDFKVEYLIYVDNKYLSENELFNRFNIYRVRPDRAFFKCPLDIIKKNLELYAEELSELSIYNIEDIIDADIPDDNMTVNTLVYDDCFDSFIYDGFGDNIFIQ